MIFVHYEQLHSLHARLTDATLSTYYISIAFSATLHRYHNLSDTHHRRSTSRTSDPEHFARSVVVECLLRPLVILSLLAAGLCYEEYVEQLKMGDS